MSPVRDVGGRPRWRRLRCTVEFHRLLTKVEPVFSRDADLVLYTALQVLQRAVQHCVTLQRHSLRRLACNSTQLVPRPRDITEIVHYHKWPRRQSTCIVCWRSRVRFQAETLRFVAHMHRASGAQMVLPKKIYV